ncbi:MAG: hypothetical protein D6732_29215 [Methanobacteriota archaeon]|nr:MAG: hypothetical protein D6732_29215 [Euryarchaeota archaeon]
MKMADDAVLSKEAFLIYRYNSGFSPKNGNLYKWIGRVSDAFGQPVEVLVELPDNFPFRPPSIRILNGEHPAADPEGYLHTRKMRRWKSEYHVFQVIKEAENLIKGGRLNPSRSATPINVALDMQKAALEQQKQQLETIIAQKKSELAQTTYQPVTEVNKQQLVEDTLLGIETELDMLEDKFDAVEISETEFAKRFFKLRKKYYLLKEVS